MSLISLLFFFNDAATTEIYTLSLHDALPISIARAYEIFAAPTARQQKRQRSPPRSRSEEHTSELQSHVNLVCRLLLEKKNKLSSASCRLRISLDLIQYAIWLHSADSVGCGQA